MTFPIPKMIEFCARSLGITEKELVREARPLREAFPGGRDVRRRVLGNDMFEYGDCQTMLSLPVGRGFPGGIPGERGCIFDRETNCRPAITG